MARPGARARGCGQRRLNRMASAWLPPLSKHGEFRMAMAAASKPRASKAQIADEIRRIVDMQLDDCKRAIKDGTRSIAVKELEDAGRRLKHLAALLKE